ncbi:hypothetical protein HAX54_003779, partial [Datura stramonium]|nr:hypothetical protein [Datura stramonium]
MGVDIKFPRGMKSPQPTMIEPSPRWGSDRTKCIGTSEKPLANMTSSASPNFSHSKGRGTILQLGAQASRHRCRPAEVSNNELAVVVRTLTPLSPLALKILSLLRAYHKYVKDYKKFSIKERTRSQLAAKKGPRSKHQDRKSLTGYILACVYESIGYKKLNHQKK